MLGAPTPAPQKFHLGWFTNFVLDEWHEPFASGGGNPWDGEFYVDFAKSLERACFDYIIYEDKLLVPDAYKGSTEPYLRRGMQVPKHDPAPLAAVVASHTRHLGVVATLSTLGYHPFTLARMCSTLDHIARGRFGWNIVTSAEDAAAQNFGLDRLPEHDLRYDMADEYMQLVNQLFDSWDRDAVLLDWKTQTYADHTKVRPVNFAGRYYKSRGPLNTAPSPQGRPAYIQAGGSEKGRDFAAKYADSIIAGANGNKGKKAFRDDIRRRAARFGRNPDDIKVLFIFRLCMGETEAEAQAKYQRSITQPRHIDKQLGLMSGITEIDFGQFDLDQTIPQDLTTNGESASLIKFAQFGSGKTLRELAQDRACDLIGTPEQCAAQMGEIMAEVGGDGFLISHPFHHINRRYILEVTEGLVPALQRLGLVRTEYTKSTLRETLREF